LHGLHEFVKAIETYQVAMKIDPSNPQLKSGLEESLAAAKKSQFGDAQSIPFLTFLIVFTRYSLFNVIL
jgi:hypothetical protein